MMQAMAHEKAEDLLGAVLDGELDALTSAQVEAHISACPTCLAEFARLTALSAAIRERATRHAMPDTLRGSLFLRPSAVERSQERRPLLDRWKHWLRPAAGGFAVGAALATGFAVLINTHDADTQLADNIIAAHVRGLQPGHLTDVEVSDQHQVKPWFDGKVDFAPTVKDLSAQGFDLVGGRLDYFQGRPAAVVVYRRHLHVIDLFVTRADTQTTAAPAAHSTSSGYNVVRWSAAGQDYWAVSDLNQTELKEFAEAVRQ
jgi:anti-sigma factor RsiW